MRRLFLALVLAAAVPVVRGDLTVEQKQSDLRQLASLYAKYYGPYEWKRDVIGFDLLQLSPWLDRVAATSSDLEFADVLADYVASLKDSHTALQLPSTFVASLGFSADFYDGQPLVDSINREQLPYERYPIQFGDELVSVDGRSVGDWLPYVWRYPSAANETTARRTALFRITYRPQRWMPFAPEIGDYAEVVLRRANGETVTLFLPWIKTGYPIRAFGPSPARSAQVAAQRQAQDGFRAIHDNLTPAQTPLAYLYNVTVGDGQRTFIGSAVKPLFSVPAGFQMRLGGNGETDAITSGVYRSGSLRIGLIRIPTFAPAIGLTAALAQLDREIQWMNDNTDGLVVDEMRNPGGSMLLVEQVCQRLIPWTFRSVGFELKPSMADLSNFGEAAVQARALNAADKAAYPDSWLAGYESILAEIEATLREGRARTAPISYTNASLDLAPVPWAYSKPLIVLVDEFAGSGGDAFPAILQDNGRGLIVGKRTAGAGGDVDAYTATTFSEGVANVTRSLMNRKAPVATAEYPAVPYIENVGVRPDIELDYMTRDNLMNGGASFVEAFTQIITEQIRKAR